ncbi:MAG: hypothetical protein ACE5QW_09400 [Thermoplasmata archaeon]
MMWARSRGTATTFVLILMILALQSPASSGTWTEIPLADLQNGDAGIIVLEVHQTYVTVDLKTTDPDVIHIPTFLTEDGSKVAKGVLQEDSQEEKVTMPMVYEEVQGESQYLLVLDQDWPQEWDELVITLDEQDWPQYEDVVIPFASQDWPQSWIWGELA